MFFTIPEPAAMRQWLLTSLAEAGGTEAGRALQAKLAEALSPEAKALMQNPRANGRAESQWQNAYYRAVRQAKAHGLLTAQGTTYSLTEAGAKAEALGRLG